MKEIKIHIVVPSYNRPKEVYAKRAVSNIIICVPQKQYEEYVEFNPDTEVVAHPDSILGIAKKRGWIYKKWGNVLMLDDDTDSFVRMWYSAGESGTRLPRQFAYEIVQYVGNIAHQLGVYLFGFEHGDQRNYNPFHPFKLKGFVRGGALGLLEGSKLSYNEPLLTGALEDDYYISLMNAYYHRMCFIDFRFGVRWKSSSLSPGGMASYRNIKVKRENYFILKRLFGDAIRKKRKVVEWRGKLESQWEVSVELPF